jgi:hypothetical protein
MHVLHVAIWVWDGMGWYGYALDSISDVKWCKHGRRAIKKHQKLCEICSPAELELCRVSGSLQPGEGIDCGLRRLIRLPHWHTPRHTRHRRHSRWQGSGGSECAAFPVRADERWEMRHGLSQMWGLTGRIGGGSQSCTCVLPIPAAQTHWTLPPPTNSGLWYSIYVIFNKAPYKYCDDCFTTVSGWGEEPIHWVNAGFNFHIPFIVHILSISLSVTDKKCINQEC